MALPLRPRMSRLAEYIAFRPFVVELQVRLVGDEVLIIGALSTRAHRAPHSLQFIHRAHLGDVPADIATLASLVYIAVTIT